MLGILHFPGVLPLRSMAERFCFHTISMVVCEGWVLFIPLLWTQLLGVLNLFCHRQNISFVPAHIPGKLTVVADLGSRQGLTST